MIALCLALFSLALPLAQPQTPAPAQSREQGVQTRGDHVMGFSHEKTTHHFLLFKDGGEIAVSAGDPKDVASVDQIRAHLSHIAKMFADGNFQAPMLIHETNAPGTATMAKRKNEIKYEYSQTERGARIHIVSDDPAAVDAIHAFLLFQILDHHTADAPSISGGPSTN